MDILELIISIISLTTTMVGLYYISNKKEVGFIYYIISIICQMYLFYIAKNTFLVIQMLILTICNIISYIKWRNDK